MIRRRPDTTNTERPSTIIIGSALYLDKLELHTPFVEAPANEFFSWLKIDDRQAEIGGCPIDPSRRVTSRVHREKEIENLKNHNLGAHTARIGDERGGGKGESNLTVAPPVREKNE